MTQLMGAQHTIEEEAVARAALTESAAEVAAAAADERARAADLEAQLEDLQDRLQEVRCAGARWPTEPRLQTGHETCSSACWRRSKRQGCELALSHASAVSAAGLTQHSTFPLQAEEMRDDAEAVAAERGEELADVEAALEELEAQEAEALDLLRSVDDVQRVHIAARLVPVLSCTQSYVNLSHGAAKHTEYGPA